MRFVPFKQHGVNENVFLPRTIKGLTFGKAGVI